MKRQTQIKLALEQTRLAFNAGEIQARGVSKFHVDANVSRPAFDGKFRNRLPVIAFKAFRQAKHSGQNARLLAPGGLVEEAALRREIALLAEAKDMSRLAILTRQYATRFGASSRFDFFNSSPQLKRRPEAGSGIGISSLVSRLLTSSVNSSRICSLLRRRRPHRT